MTEQDQPEPDPRTDGVGDGGKRELDPPSEEEIAAGVEYDRTHRKATLAEQEDDLDEIERVKMRPFTEDVGESW